MIHYEETLSIKITKELFDQLKGITKRTGIPYSKIVRSGIVKMVRQFAKANNTTQKERNNE